ncbi:MAG: lipase family protein [Nitrosomonas sp.]|nr:lipase family protein [Nitrosomonas sp.]
MSDVPMYFPPSPFNLDDVRICSDLVDTAYDMYSQWQAQSNPDRKAFKWIPHGPAMYYGQPIWGAEKFLWIFKQKEPFAFTARSSEDTAYLVFRGTESVEDWTSDLDADQTPYTRAQNFGMVHDGFMKLYDSMANDMIESLATLGDCKKLFIIGHSLGSGLSTLSVPDVINRTQFRPATMPVFHYNLASPRVGDPRFVEKYQQSQVPTFRVVNTCDLVPNVPLAVCDEILYEHVGTSVDFTAQYGSLTGNHSAEYAYRYALLHPNHPQSGG